MREVIFLLGNAKKLALVELRAVVPGKITDESLIATAKINDEVDLPQLQKTLGGTIKIGTLIKRLPAKTDESVISYQLVEYLVGLGRPKIHFALGELGRDHLTPLDVRELKTRLEENGIKARFAECSRHGAGAALLLHRKNLVELLVINTGESIILARTETVQDIDEWSWRDRAKPYADRKKGMLPPKVARMMINLAGKAEKPRRLYDPFCGTGTVLLEAASLGNYTLLGSDLDVKAVLGTGENLDWWQQETGQQIENKLFVKDAASVNLADVGGRQVDLIVTEPFLGKQTPQASQLAGIFRGLEKMYWGAMRAWTKILADGAKVVMVWPRVTDERGRIYTLDHLLDKLSSLGYNKESDGLIYARDQAVVTREICLFEWKSKKE